MHGEELAKLVSSILRQRLKPFDLADVAVIETVDHDGEEVVQAVATYKPGARELDTVASLQVVQDVMRELAKRGDNRFFHLKHRWPDDVLPVADVPSA